MLCCDGINHHFQYDSHNAFQTKKNGRIIKKNNILDIDIWISISCRNDKYILLTNIVCCSHCHLREKWKRLWDGINVFSPECIMKALYYTQSIIGTTRSPFLFHLLPRARSASSCRTERERADERERETNENSRERESGHCLSFHSTNRLTENPFNSLCYFLRNSSILQILCNSHSIFLVPVAYFHSSVCSNVSLLHQNTHRNERRARLSWWEFILLIPYVPCIILYYPF